MWHICLRSHGLVGKKTFASLCSCKETFANLCSCFSMLMLLPWPSHFLISWIFWHRFSQLLINDPDSLNVQVHPSCHRRLPGGGRRLGMMASLAATKSSKRSEWCLWIVKWLHIRNVIWVRLWQDGKSFYQCSCILDPNLRTLRVETKLAIWVHICWKEKGRSKLGQALVDGKWSPVFPAWGRNCWRLSTLPVHKPWYGFGADSMWVCPSLTSFSVSRWL